MRCGTCTPLEAGGEMGCGTCIRFSPSALVGGVRGRVSELAGGVIISKDKAPPASALALAPPPKAGGEMGYGEIYSCLARQKLRHKKIVVMDCDLMALCYNAPYNALRGLYYDKHC